MRGASHVCHWGSTVYATDKYRACRGVQELDTLRGWSMPSVRVHSPSEIVDPEGFAPCEGRSFSHEAGPEGRENRQATSAGSLDPAALEGGVTA